MSDPIILLEFDDQKGLEFVEKLTAELEKTGAAAKETGVALNESLKGATDQSAALNKEMASTAEAIKKQIAPIEAVKSKLAGLLAVQDQLQKKIANYAGGTQSLKSLKVELDNVDAEIKKITVDATTGSAAIDKMAKSTSKAADSTEAFGKTTSDTGKKLGGLAQAQEVAAGATEKVSFAQRALNIIMLANPIGLLITAVGILTGYFSKLQPVIDKIQQITAGLGATSDVVAPRLVTLGESILAFFAGNISGAAQGMSEAFTGVASAIGEAYTAAVALEKQFQELEKAQLQAAVGIRQLESRRDAFVKISQDETKSLKDRIEAVQKAIILDKEASNQRVAFAKRDAELTVQQNAGKDTNAALKENNEARIKLIDEQSQATEKQIGLQEKLSQLYAIEAKILEKITNDLERLRVESQTDGVEKDLAAVEKKYNDLQAVVRDGVIQLNEIESRRNLSPVELAQRQELYGLEKSLEERRLDALLNVLEGYAEKDIAAEEKLRKEKEALRKKDYDAKVKALKQEQDLRDGDIALTDEQSKTLLATLQSEGVSERKIKQAQFEFDKVVKAARLQSEIKFQEGLLSITDQTDTKTIEAINQKIALLKQQIATIDATTFRGDNKPITIFDLLGIDDKDGRREALAAATQQVLNSLNEISQARIKAAEVNRKAKEDEVKAAEDALKKEQDANEKGSASNIALRKLELAEAKKARDEALKEETKAKRAQIALDSVSQLSSLVVASANIFKALSSIPFVGVPLAIGTIALMFGAFAKAKADALKSVPKLRQGKRVEGRSHEAGGEDYTGVDGRRYEVENKEWIIGTKHSTEHDRFLSRLNAGEFQHIDLNKAVARGAHYENPLSVSVPRIQKIQELRQEQDDRMYFDALQRAVEKGSQAIVDTILSKPNIYPFKGGYIKETQTGNVRQKDVVLPQ